MGESVGSHSRAGLYVPHGLEVDGNVSFDGIGSDTGTDVIITSGGDIKKKTSSIEYKENVKDLKIDSEKLYKLNPVSYNYKITNTKDIGLIAEEVDEILPELVYRNEKTGKPESVKYSSLSVILLDELKKLRQEIQELKENK